MNYLVREYYKHCTIGSWLLPDGQEIFTLEQPWNNNKIGASCIPEGEYIVDRDHTGKHQFYRFRDSEVTPRSAIEIHAGRVVEHSAGCILPSLAPILPTDPKTTNSQDAVDLLLHWFGEHSFVLNIRSAKGKKHVIRPH